MPDDSKQTAPATAGTPARPRGKRPPGPRGHFLLGSAREQARDRLGFQMALHREYGDIVRWRVAHITLYQVTHPEHVKYGLQDNHRNYTKGRLLYSIVSPLGGDGLFTSGRLLAAAGSLDAANLSSSAYRRLR